MRAIITAIFIFLISASAFAKECPESFKKLMRQDGAKLVDCEVVNGLIPSSQPVAFVVRDFDKPFGELSGVTVSIHESFNKRAYYVEPGFGKKAVKFKAYGKKVNYIVKDINKDGSLDFAIRPLVSDFNAPLIIKTYNRDLDRFDTISPIYPGKNIKADSFLGYPSKLIIIKENSISCPVIKEISKKIGAGNFTREVFGLQGSKFIKKN